jgi:hypothetical protein
MKYVSTPDPLAVAVVEAIHSGNVKALKRFGQWKGARRLVERGAKTSL